MSLDLARSLNGNEQDAHATRLISAQVDRTCQRRPLTRPGGAAEGDLDARAASDAADSRALTDPLTGSHRDQRAKAAALAHHDLSGRMCFGEAALLWSLSAGLTDDDPADRRRT